MISGTWQRCLHRIRHVGYRGWHGVSRRVPGPCALCGQRLTQGELCADCQRQIEAAQPARQCLRCAVPTTLRELCADCHRQPPAFTAVWVAMMYTPPADALILQLKQSRRYGRARLLADLLATRLRAQAPPHWRLAPPWVVPIPSSQAALRLRGFNPAGEVAAGLARQLDWPLRRAVLTWQDDAASRSQRGLGWVARRQRSQHGFAVRAPWSSRLSGVEVLLVDDVVTTGSTLQGAATALLSAGAAAVWGAAVARTPPPGWRPSL